MHIIRPGSSRKDRLKSVIVYFRQLHNRFCFSSSSRGIQWFTVGFFCRVCIVAFTATVHTALPNKHDYAVRFSWILHFQPRIASHHIGFLHRYGQTWDWKYFNPSLCNASLNNIIIVEFVFKFSLRLHFTFRAVSAGRECQCVTNQRVSCEHQQLWHKQSDNACTCQSAYRLWSSANF